MLASDLDTNGGSEVYIGVEWERLAGRCDVRAEGKESIEVVSLNSWWVIVAFSDPEKTKNNFVGKLVDQKWFYVLGYLLDIYLKVLSIQ